MLPQSWVGKTIGNRYQMEMLLGQGGMSAVYRANDPNLRRKVAIKLIHPHLSMDSKFIDRFKEEAAAVARLRHPHIVQVHDFNYDGENYYMVMEYLEGETLQARLKRLNSEQRFLPFPEALQICMQICNAAGYAHNHDLIHRDIKPANVMLNLNGQAILMDFGIVKIVGGDYHTATGATVGTAMYMSPEQIRSERVDERSDIYSLGVTLYEMLSGRPPYQADSALTLMMMVLNDPLPDLQDFRKEVPKDLQAVVEKALAKDLSQRFRTMAEMAAALQQVQTHLAIATPAPLTTLVDEMEVEPDEPQDLPLQRLTEVDASSSYTPELPVDDREIPVASSVEAMPIEPASVLSESAVPKARSSSRLRSRFFIISAAVTFLVMAVVIGILLFIWPPFPELAPISRPTVPITAQTAPYVVNLARWKTASTIEDLAYSPDSAILGTANNRDWLRFSQFRFYSCLWRVDTGSLQRYLFRHTQQVNSVAFSPDGSLFASASDDGTLNLWRVSDGSLVRKIEPSIGGITSVEFSPNNMLLAASSWDGIVGLYQLSDGHLLRTIQGNGIAIKDVEFSPDGKLLASASEDNTVFLWRVSDGSLVHTLRGHSAMVHKVAFSPDGTLLASASEDHTIKLWQVAEGSLLNTIQGHSEPVYDVVFSPDGSLLASGSMDRTLRLWQVTGSQMLRILEEHLDGIQSVIFSPDGRLLVSGSVDGEVHFWGISEAIPVEAEKTPTAP